MDREMSLNELARQIHENAVNKSRPYKHNKTF